MTFAPSSSDSAPATTEAADSFITVEPPDDFGGTTDQWAAEVVKALFTDVGEG